MEIFEYHVHPMHKYLVFFPLTYQLFQKFFTLQIFKSFSKIILQILLLLFNIPFDYLILSLFLTPIVFTVVRLAVTRPYVLNSVDARVKTLILLVANIHRSVVLQEVFKFLQCGIDCLLNVFDSLLPLFSFCSHLF
jgi:hypothetical protein